MNEGILRIFVLSFLFIYCIDINAQITLFPYFENFETNDGDYLIGGTDPSWEHGIPSNHQINGAFSGTKAWVTSLESFPNCPENSFIESPLFDFSGFVSDPILNFQAYILTSSIFSVEVSTDGGLTYNLLGSPADPNWYDFAQGFSRQEDDFKKFSHILNGTAGSSDVKIRFVNYIPFSIRTEGVAIDDIEIKGISDFDDLAITTIELPEFSPLLGESEEITITVENFGGATKELVGVVVIIDGPSGSTEHMEVLNTVINASGSMEIALSTLFDLSVNGNYTINISLQVVDDEVIDNNTLVSSTGRVTTYSGGLPYSEDYSAAFLFEEKSIANIPGISNQSFSAEDGRIILGSDDSFDSDVIIIGSTLSGKTSDLIITLDLSTYNSMNDQIRMSTRISSPNFGNSPNNQIFIRGNVGSEWLSIYDWQDNLVAGSDVANLTLLNISETLLGGTQDYSSSFQIRFGLGADDNSQTFLLMDDLVIEETPTIDVAVIGAVTPKVSPLLGSNESLSIEIANYGKASISNIPVRAFSLIQSDPDISEIANITLMPGESEIYDFVNGGDFDEIGNYRIIFATELTGDESAPNNQIELRTGKGDIYMGNLPFLETFEGVSSFINNVNTAVIDGLPFTSFVASNGSISFRDSEFFKTNAANIQATNFGATADLIFTLDLSIYNASSDELKLGAGLFSRFPFSSDNNKIFLRGAAGDTWIELFDWGTELESGSSLINFSSPNISQILVNAGQNYSDTFQLRFGTGGGNLEISNVFVEEISDLNASITGGVIPGISSFLTDSEIVSVQLHNAGLLDLNSIEVGYLLTNPDGSQTTINEIADLTLAAGESITYEFTERANFSQPGNYEFNFFIEPGSDGSDLGNEFRTMRTGKIDVYEGGLPFIENFNQANFLFSRGLNIAVIDGLQSATYITSDLNGFIRLQQSSDPEDFEARIGFTNGSISDLIFTLDLSDWEVNSDRVELAVNLSNQGSKDFPNNRIFIRGDATSEWLELFDWSNEVENNGLEVELLIQNISETLADGSQDFGESFQIRFGHEDSGTIVIDDIRIDLINTPPVLVNPLSDQEFDPGFVSFDIDLSSVFSDIDNDPLVYSAISDDEKVLLTSVENSILTLTEVSSGTVNINITASDGKNGSASDQFQIKVNEQPVDEEQEEEEEEEEMPEDEIDDEIEEEDTPPDTVTSVEEGIDYSITAYPNPTTGLITINLSLSTQDPIGQINLMNLAGTKLKLEVLKLDSNNYEIDLSNVRSGIYLIVVDFERKELIYRIIKE